MLFHPRGFTRYVHCCCRHTMPRSIARRGRGRGSRRGRGGARRRRPLPSGSARVSEPKKKVQTTLSLGQEDDLPPLTGRTRIIVDPHGHDDNDDGLTADRSRASGPTAASKPSESVWVPGYRELPVTPEPGSPFRRPSSPLRAPTEALDVGYELDSDDERWLSHQRGVPKTQRMPAKALEAAMNRLEVAHAAASSKARRAAFAERTRKAMDDGASRARCIVDRWTEHRAADSRDRATTTATATMETAADDERVRNRVHRWATAQRLEGSVGGAGAGESSEVEGATEEELSSALEGIVRGKAARRTVTRRWVGKREAERAPLLRPGEVEELGHAWRDEQRERLDTATCRARVLAVRRIRTQLERARTLADMVRRREKLKRVQLQKRLESGDPAWVTPAFVERALAVALRDWTPAPGPGEE